MRYYAEMKKGKKFISGNFATLSTLQKWIKEFEALGFKLVASIKER